MRASSPFEISLTGSVPEFIQVVDSEINIDQSINGCLAGSYSINVVLTSQSGLQNTYPTEIKVNEEVQEVVLDFEFAFGFLNNVTEQFNRTSNVSL